MAYEMRIKYWSSDVCSAYLFKHLRPWLLKAGFSEERLDALFVEFGQGFQSMSPALRDLESALLGGKVRHGNHPVLAMCAANAVVTPDPAGNRQLNKRSEEHTSELQSLMRTSYAAFGLKHKIKN